ncbi:transposase [Streptomyces sp. NBC_00439]|uniref:transposase n=1 Tax=unclassified Streptomyces TaxID=2593676 RepID=UPI00224C7DA0|nr:transposase [Streptomyces sp. NBC_00439]MCX5103399.1 transposase [Streptomyces sp. NBC_00439]WSX06438.1 transposase [Streptomyces sp. NBC_00987]
MTDAQWAVVRPLLPVPGWLEGRGGQPEAYCHRATLDAVHYLVDNGTKWRAMPADFPPWDRVYASLVLRMACSGAVFRVGAAGDPLDTACGLVRLVDGRLRPPGRPYGVLPRRLAPAERPLGVDHFTPPHSQWPAPSRVAQGCGLQQRARQFMKAQALDCLSCRSCLTG